MSSIHSRAGRLAYRTQTSLDLELQRLANAWAIGPDERELVAQAAEILGLEDTARRLRETNARRDRPTLESVPDDPRRSLRAGHDRPLLTVLRGGGAEPEGAVDHGAVAWGRVARSAEHSLLTLPLSPDDAYDFRSLLSAAWTAALPQPPQRG